MASNISNYFGTALGGIFSQQQSQYAPDPYAHLNTGWASGTAGTTTITIAPAYGITGSIPNTSETAWLDRRIEEIRVHL